MTNVGVPEMPRCCPSLKSSATLCACSPEARSALNLSSSRPASRASSTSFSSGKPPCWLWSSRSWYSQNFPCSCAALAATAAFKDSCPRYGKSRHSILSVPLSTYSCTSFGSTSRANLPQNGHWKSPYSTITTGASASPSSGCPSSGCPSSASLCGASSWSPPGFAVCFDTCSSRPACGSCPEGWELCAAQPERIATAVAINASQNRSGHALLTPSTVFSFFSGKRTSASGVYGEQYAAHVLRGSGRPLYRAPPQKMHAGSPRVSEPAGPLEVAVEGEGDQSHKGEGHHVSVPPVQLRHIVEVHPVDTGYEGRDDDDRRPGGDLLRLVVLVHAHESEVDAEDVRKQLAKPLGSLRHAQHALLDVAQVPAHLGVDATHLVLRKAPQRPRQGLRGLVELDDLAEELVDALRNVGLVPEDLHLDLVDVVLEAFDHRDVIFHDAVHDRVEDRVRTLAEQRRPAFGPPAHLDQLVRLAVTDRDDEVRSHECVDLAELDLLPLL